MSLHTSLLMIQGNHLSTMDRIFTPFHYRILSAPRIISEWNQTQAAVQFFQPGKPRTVVHKAVCCLNGWTVILDPEMVMMMESEACLDVSRSLRRRVFGMTCEGGSNTYAYAFFDGVLKRYLWIGDGNVFTDTGDLQPEENAIPPQLLCEDDVLTVMQRLGVTYANLLAAGDYRIYELDKSETGLVRPAQVTAYGSTSEPRSWWHFW